MPIRSLHLPLGGWDGLDQHGQLTETEVLHAKQCSSCKDANSLAGAVGIKVEDTLLQCAKVAEAKPSERSFSGVMRA